MWPSVQSAFLPFSQGLEGDLPYMYLDILGYVTTGVGNKVDPVGDAEGLPWVNADGSAASSAEVVAAWNAVDAERSDPKGQMQTSGLATHYGQAFAGLTSVHLTPAGIAQLFQRVVATDEAMLRTYFPAWDSLPADAQMAILSMAWALGPGFPPQFPTFTAAVNRRDFTAAAANASFRGAGVATRIAANKRMLANAATVEAAGSDPSVLYYPGAAPADDSSGLAGAIVGGIVGIVGGILWGLYKRGLL